MHELKKIRRYLNKIRPSGSKEKLQFLKQGIHMKHILMFSKLYLLYFTLRSLNHTVDILSPSSEYIGGNATVKENSTFNRFNTTLSTTTLASRQKQCGIMDINSTKNIDDIHSCGKTTVTARDYKPVCSIIIAIFCYNIYFWRWYRILMNIGRIWIFTNK